MTVAFVIGHAHTTCVYALKLCNIKNYFDANNYENYAKQAFCFQICDCICEFLRIYFNYLWKKLAVHPGQVTDRCLKIRISINNVLVGIRRKLK